MRLYLLGLFAFSLAPCAFAADSFTYTSGNNKQNTFSGAQNAMAAGQQSYQAMAADPNMMQAAMFFQSRMMVDTVVRFLQSTLSAATADSNLKGCPATDYSNNFTVTDASGNTLGYYVTSSSNTDNVPADIKGLGLTCSLVIALGKDAATAKANSPSLYVYFPTDVTGSNSTGAMMINNVNPGSFLGGGAGAGATTDAPPVTAMPLFSGYYIWNHPDGGTTSAMGLFSMNMPSTDQKGVNAGGMTVSYKELVGTDGADKTAITFGMPGAGAGGGGVTMSMTATGTMGTNATTGLKQPTGDWTIANSLIIDLGKNATIPTPTTAIVINFASAGATPTFVSSNATPPTIDQSQVPASVIATPNGSGSNCGAKGDQTCSPFGAAPSSGATTAPGLPTGLVPPAPGSGGTQPTSTITSVFPSTSMTFPKPGSSTPVVTF